MPSNDEALRAVLSELADASDGRLTFTVTNSSSAGQEFGLMLAQSRNPIYVFRFMDSEGVDRTCVAFTLALNGNSRPATRAEALGKSLANTDGGIFALNPFLLVFDYAGERILGTPAIDLFGAFARLAQTRAIPFADTATFSLSPNFQAGTITMYADLRAPVVWGTSVKGQSLTLVELLAFLERVVQSTESQRSEVRPIVEAVKARLAAVAAPPTGGTSTVAAPPEVHANPVLENQDDDLVRVDIRLWRMILAAIQSAPATILVGPPGTGKTALVRKAIVAISDSRRGQGLEGIQPPLWATPDESWTARELIGGETVAGGEIVFRPGWVLRAIEEDRWLVLDEANRGDLDRIFGALLTWLSGGTVAVGVESSARASRLVEMGWTQGVSRVESIDGVDGNPGVLRYLAGDDWKLLGTYNALDSQRVFRLGAALGRRFLRVPIPPIAPEIFVDTLQEQASDLSEALRGRIALLYWAHYEDEVSRLGPALFLGMCRYVRVALAQVTAESDRQGQPVSEVGADDGVQGEAQGEVNPTGGSPVALPPAEAQALSEAYVLNLGTLLAQMEEPDFEQLCHRIRAAGALSPEEVEWVSVVMRALA